MPRFSFRSAVVALAVVGVVRAADPTPATTSAMPAVTAAVPDASPTAGGAGSETVESAVSDAATRGGCGGACGTLCGGSAGDLWIDTEWLYWGATGTKLPALARAAPAGTPLNVAGIPGGVGRTVAGDRWYNDDWRNGFRLTTGLWFGALHRVGVEGDFFFLGQSRFRDTVGPDGSQILARPYFDTVRRNVDGSFTPVAPFPSAQFISVPGLLAGTFTAEATSEFSGAGVTLACAGCGPCQWRVGYRYLNLTDTLFTRDDLQTATTRFEIEERFRVENHFHGVPVGFLWEKQGGKCFLSVKGAVSLGVTRTVVDIDGGTTLSVPGAAPQSFTGGLFALPSNIGRYTHDSFAVVPEATVRVGCQLNPSVRLYVGYNFIYWSSVVRADGVLDQRVNTSQQPNNGPVTGPLFPRFEPRTTDFLTHGAMIGMQFTF